MHVEEHNITFSHDDNKHVQPWLITSMLNKVGTLILVVCELLYIDTCLGVDCGHVSTTWNKIKAYHDLHAHEAYPMCIGDKWVEAPT